MYNTDSITSETRKNIPNGTNFNKCEKCGYRPRGYIRKSVRFYVRYKTALCDECVDANDGIPWKEKGGQL